MTKIQRQRIFFFFNDTATTEIYTLSLHDALPISNNKFPTRACGSRAKAATRRECPRDRKSTRLNSSHSQISYAVFCLKKKKPGRRISKQGQQRQRRVSARQAGARRRDAALQCLHL